MIQHRTMMLSSVLFILLQLCSLQTLVVSSPVCHLEGDLVRDAHLLLKQVQDGPFPVHCRKYNANISFPDSVFSAAGANQCRRALWVVYESLEGAGQVFDNHSQPENGLNWHERNLDDFQNLQYQLLEEGGCLSGAWTSHLLTSYFRNVADVVQQQDSAACGWMALRRDLLRVLKMALQNHHNCFTWRKAQ